MSKNNTAKCSCGKRFKNRWRLRDHIRDSGCTPPAWFAEQLAAMGPQRGVVEDVGENETGVADFTGQCEVCGASPVHPETGMCGPCTFGEADTIGGNW